MTESKSLRMKEKPLTQIGDTLQSEASRIVAWLRSEAIPCPYEVFMALCEVETAAQDWTAARSATAETGNPGSADVDASSSLPTNLEDGPAATQGSETTGVDDDVA